MSQIFNPLNAIIHYLSGNCNFLFVFELRPRSCEVIKVTGVIVAGSLAFIPSSFLHWFKYRHTCTWEKVKISTNNFKYCYTWTWREKLNLVGEIWLRPYFENSHIITVQLYMYCRSKLSSYFTKCHNLSESCAAELLKSASLGILLHWNKAIECS